MWDEPDDDEDWYDDLDELDDDSELLRCPDCGAGVPGIADKCPACGYWIAETDRRAMGRGARPLWTRVTAIIVLVAFLLTILGIAAALL